MKITKTKSYKAAFTGIAAAVAITLSFLEGLIPTAAFMPPGAKAGFSNIAVMFAALRIYFVYSLNRLVKCYSFACGAEIELCAVGDAFKVAVCFPYARCHGIFYVTRRRSAQHPCDVFVI